jgi:hypothetical protein
LETLVVVTERVLTEAFLALVGEITLRVAVVVVRFLAFVEVFAVFFVVFDRVVLAAAWTVSALWCFVSFVVGSA